MISRNGLLLDRQEQLYFQEMKVAKSRGYKDKLRGHRESVIALYSPYGEQGHMLYSVSRDGFMRGWDLAKRTITIKLLLDKTKNTKQEREQQEKQMDTKGFRDNREQIICAIFNENYLFGSYEDCTINQWGISQQGEIVKEYIGHTKRISNLVLIPSKQLLVSSSHDATIRTWDIETSQSVTVYKTQGPVHLMRISEQNTILAIVNRNILYEINPLNNTITKCIRFDKHSITSFYFKEDLLVFGNIENRILVYNLSSFDPDKPQELVPVKTIEGIGGWTLSIEFNNGYLYTGCDDRKIRVYSWPQIIEVEELAGHDDGIISLAFADRMLYSGSFDHSIRSWDTKEMVQRISQRQLMSHEDIQSKKYEVYYGVVFKNKKKKLPSKKKK